MTLGLDTYCLDSLRTGRTVTGPLLVGQNLYHRITTAQGWLPGGEDDKDTIDITEWIGEISTPALIASLPARLENHALKDQRIEEAAVSVSSTVNGPVTSYVISFHCETGEGPFTLVVSVADVTVTLLGLTEG